MDATLQDAPVDPRFRSPEHTVALAWERLQAHLRAHGLALDLDLETAPRQFAGGLGNLNYLVSIDGEPCVLRRPPPGPIPRGAHDMAREHRVLSRLWEQFPLAPRALHFSDDAGVIGAPFLLMQYRSGIVIGGILPDRTDAAIAGPALSRMLVDVLARLHAVEPAAVGLQAFGRPEGFLARTVEGWAHRAAAASGPQPGPLIGDLVGWLRARLVPDGPPTLLHSDFKLDNLVLDPASLRPRALLDWDMATRGDPLLDLATLLSYWTEATDPPGIRDLRQMPTAETGFATRAEIVAAYAAATGRDVSDLPFHRVLALFKLGIVFMQLHARYLAGATHDERYARFGALSRDILAHAHDVAFGSST